MISSQVLFSLSKRVLHGAVVANFALYSSFWKISEICKLAEVNTNMPLVFN